jgi:hypothetical protein
MEEEKGLIPDDGSDDVRQSIELLNACYAAVERALYTSMNRQALLDELQRAEDLLELAIAHVKEQQ